MTTQNKKIYKDCMLFVYRVDEDLGDILALKRNEDYKQ